jgi:hypothetical protein
LKLGNEATEIVYGVVKHENWAMKLPNMKMGNEVDTALELKNAVSRWGNAIPENSRMGCEIPHTRWH